MCSKGFASYNELKRHKIVCHKQVSVSFVNIKCGFCEKNLTNNEQLKNHNCFISNPTQKLAQYLTSSINKNIKKKERKKTEQLKDDCLNVVIKEEMPLDIYDEID